jgi:DNA-binding NarL/FixJ family response regulator
LLLVEDDAQAGRILAEALKRDGWTVVHMKCAMDVRCMQKTSRFAAALVDVGLPDGSGFEVVEYLRTLPSPCACVVLTGGGLIDGGRVAVQLGVVDYLLKPVTLDLLRVALSRAVKQTERMRQWVHRFSEHPPIKVLEPAQRRSVRHSQAVATAAVEFGLTDRQSEALIGVANGLSDKEIQEMMDVSYSRVRQLVSAGFRKLGIRGRNEFIKFLADRGASRLSS